MPLLNLNQNQQVTFPIPISIILGGTGASDAATARSNLGLGSAALLNLTLPLPINQGGTGETVKSFVDLTLAQSVGGNKEFTGLVSFSDTTQATSITTGTNFGGGVSVGKNLFVGGKIAPCIAPNIDWAIDLTAGANTINIAPGGVYDLATGSGLVVIFDAVDGNCNYLTVAAGGVTSLQAAGVNIVAGAPPADKVGLYYNVGTAKYRIQNNRATTRTLIVSTIKFRAQS